MHTVPRVLAAASPTDRGATWREVCCCRPSCRCCLIKRCGRWFVVCLWFVGTLNLYWRFYADSIENPRPRPMHFSHIRSAWRQVEFDTNATRPIKYVQYKKHNLPLFLKVGRMMKLNSKRHELDFCGMLAASGGTFAFQENTRSQPEPIRTFLDTVRTISHKWIYLHYW